MLYLSNALERYRVARRFGLPFELCVKAAVFGKGTPKDNFNKMTKNKET